MPIDQGSQTASNVLQILRNVGENALVPGQPQGDWAQSLFGRTELDDLIGDFRRTMFPKGLDVESVLELGDKLAANKKKEKVPKTVGAAKKLSKGYAGPCPYIKVGGVFTLASNGSKCGRRAASVRPGGFGG